MSLEKVNHIVLVLSGKGGVGKSSITTQLALSLSLAGKSVGILDIDLTGPSIPRLLGLEAAKITQAPGGWVPVKVHDTQTLPPLPAELGLPGIQDGEPEEERLNVSSDPQIPSQEAATNGSSTNGHATPIEPKDSSAQPIGPLHAISLAFLLPSRSSAVVWRGPKKTAMVRQFLTDVLWPSLDYLLIDTPPGTSDEHISLVETLLKHTQSPSPSTAYPHLTGAVIVTTPQAVAVCDVRKEVNFCKKVGVGILGVVENMSGYVCECCGERTNLFGKGGGEVMSAEFGVPFLGSVPLDRQWGVVVEEGGWARYGQVKNSTDRLDHVDDDGEPEGEIDVKNEVQLNGASNGQTTEEREGLLVDRYRSCSLCSVFKDITTQLMDIVDTQSTGSE